MDICFNLITHLPPTPSNYKKESMLNLEELLLLENTKLAFKLQHHLLPVRLHNMLNSDSRMKSLQKRHHYETRNKNIPKLPSARTRHYHTSFLFQSLKDYEMVPLEIRNTKTLSTFKIKMKKNCLNPDLSAPGYDLMATHHISLLPVTPSHTYHTTFIKLSY